MRRLSLILPLLVMQLSAQQVPSPYGHWEGQLECPWGKLPFALDLKEAPPGGELRFLQMGQKALLSGLSVQGREITFTVTFFSPLAVKASLSGQGRDLEGTVAWDGTPYPFRAGREPLPPSALDPKGILTRFRKEEADIPMRDGVKLHTVIYIPRAPKEPFPFLLERTPYCAGPYGPGVAPTQLGPSELFDGQEDAFVHQDVRGRFLSEGTFEDCRPVKADKGPLDTDEGTDTFDTLTWLLQHIPGNNGRAGQWGISYPGHFTVQGMRCGHPALVAVSPQAPMMDLWVGDDAYHNGAFQLTANFSFYLFFHTRSGGPAAEAPPPDQPGTRDGYRYFLEGGSVGPLGRRMFQAREPLWDQTLAHPADDAFWQARDLRPQVKDIRPAVLTVGGWFDGEDLFGALACHRALRAQSPATEAHLVMGPWSHGQWAAEDASNLGHACWGQNTTRPFKELEFAFFQSHLKGTPAPALPEATVFETGSNRWRTFDAWPPREARAATLYLQPGGRLGFTCPGSAKGADAYRSDPAHPVPYVQSITFNYDRTYMADDQRFASTRPDVLVYRTDPLTEDLTLVGPVKPVLEVSTTGTDSDWVVKLIDVNPQDMTSPQAGGKDFVPGGAEMLVRADIFRGKYRKGFQHPVPFKPGVPDEVAWTLPDICHTFRKGHRIMVQVQSSWFPLADRNPQTFCDIFWARPADFRPATQRVYHEKERPSRLEVLTLPQP
jgi:hypothetical protein